MKLSRPSITLLHTGFHDLLCDAVYQHRLARRAPGSYIENRHARASIIASAIASESFANCLLDGIEGDPAPRRLYGKSVLEKTNFYLSYFGKGPLDDSRPEVEKLQELRKLRNNFAHRQAETVEVDVGSLGVVEGGSLSYPISMTPKDRWLLIGVPKNSMYWEADSSWRVLVALTEFLRYVLIEQLALTPTEARKLVASKFRTTVEADIGGKAGSVTLVSPTPVLEDYRLELNGDDLKELDLAFLGIS